jgi:glucose-1-phosphate thymidylyltransferase
VKGLVLSGGQGTRLRPLTYTGAKQLVPVANKPVLFWAIEDLVEAGITDIGIIVGDTGSQVRAAVGDGRQFGAQVTYIQQDAPLGIAHGIKIAHDFLGEEPFVLFLGDNFIRDGIVSLVDAFREGAMNCQIILKKVPNPEQFGVAVMDGERVARLVEKPKQFISDLAVIGIYMFDHHVHEAVRNIKPSARGELEITETIQYLIDNHHTVRSHLLTGWWIDTGKMQDILDANRLILDVMEPRLDGIADAHSQIIGRVTLEKGARITNSTVRGPAIIGENTHIENSYVGPYTAIYHDCTISGSEIEHCVILENCRITDIGHRIEDSLIGRNVEIAKSNAKPRAYRMVVGDFSKVGIL